MTCVRLDDEAMPDDYTRFAAIAGELFGDVVDPRELWAISKANDPSEVHIDGDPQKKKKGHSNAARLLVLGTAAEADAAVNAGTQAVRAVRSTTATGGSKAGAVGRAALQGANLGVGLFAAHRLSSDAKKQQVSKISLPRIPLINDAVEAGLHHTGRLVQATEAAAGRATGRMIDTHAKKAAIGAAAAGAAGGAGGAALATGLTVHHANKKAKKRAEEPVGKGLKPINVKPIKIVRTQKLHLDADQLKQWKSHADRGAAYGAAGMGMVAGGSVFGVAGHRAGVKRGKRLSAPEREPEQVAKAFRVKPLNAGQLPRVVSLKARRRPMGPIVAKSAHLNLVGPSRALRNMGLEPKKKITPLPAGPVVSKAADLSWHGVVSKVDEDKHQVFGWCSLSSVDGAPVVDLQGDYVPLEEIEKSAYKYVIESRKGGDMHKRVSKFDMDEPLHTADLIESFVVTPEKLRGMGLAEDALPHGWWVGFKVNDETQWQMVKSGERAGFSIHGTGQRRAAA